jgi:predicted DNA-binding protein
MTTKKNHETLPRPTAELEDIAAYYDTHDTSGEMEPGNWVDPRPMQTTSLRLPAEVVNALKSLAQDRGMRYTALVREIVEQAVQGARVAESEDLAEINQRLARIEAAVVARSEEPPRRSRQRVPASNSGQSRAVRGWAKKQAATAEGSKTARRSGSLRG